MSEPNEHPQQFFTNENSVHYSRYGGNHVPWVQISPSCTRNMVCLQEYSSSLLLNLNNQLPGFQEAFAMHSLSADHRFVSIVHHRYFMLLILSISKMCPIKYQDQPGMMYSHPVTQ
jgi:hypothetical protein